MQSALRVRDGWYPWTLAAATITCALAPAYTIRWHLGFHPIILPTTLLEIAILVTIAVFLVETFRGPHRLEWRTAFTYPALLFLLAGAISVVVAPDKRAALGLYRAYLIEPIAFFFVVVTIANTAEKALTIALGLAVGAIGLAIPNIYVVQHAIRHHTLHVDHDTPVVIYMTANAVAMFLEPLIALAGSIVVHSAYTRHRVVGLVFLAIAIPAAILTLSRGGLLTLAGVAIGLALSHRRRWRLLAAGAAAALATLLVPNVAARLAVNIDLNNPSNTLVGRSQLWSAALQMLRDHPIFGAGLSGFTERLGPYWNAVHTDRFIDPHNIVLNFWSETGLLGLAAFSWILAVAFIASWRGWHHGGADWRPIHIGVFLALVGVVLHGLIDVPYFKNDLSLEFWVLLGFIWAGTWWGMGRKHTAGVAVAA